MQPTVFEGNNKMRIFQEEIFGPVLSVTTFKDEDEALSIANDTLSKLKVGSELPESASPQAVYSHNPPQLARLGIGSLKGLGAE
jgi:hypothetical protein